MNSITWDWGLFEALNFDGPEWLDMVMRLVSGIKAWIPLYLLILYIVWRKYSWRGLLAFVVAVGAAVGFADIVSGIFKQQGPSLKCDGPEVVPAEFLDPCQAPSLSCDSSACV